MQAQHVLGVVALVLVLATLRDRRRAGGGAVTLKQRAWLITAAIFGGVAAWLSLGQ